MTITFFDRTREINILQDKVDSLTKGELLVIYGRRRIGKTELMRFFLKKNKHKQLFFYVNELARSALTKQFMEDIKVQRGDCIKIQDWSDLFQYLAEESEEKFIVIIDEFQRMEKISPDFITMLQQQWDTILKSKKIMLVLLGSSMGMMNNLCLSTKAPLYQRCTSKIRIKPFRYIDMREMFSNLTEEDKIVLFSIFGGTAHYLSLVRNQYEGINKSIINLVLKEGSPLYDEPQQLLSSELRSFQKHNAILTAIAKGKTTFNEIKDYLDVKEPGRVSSYLEQLSNKLDIIRKDVAIDEKKNIRYKITDNFFRFWYRFVMESKSTLEMGKHDLVIKKIQDGISQYVAAIFEDVCKELLILYNGIPIKGKKVEFEDIGSWWTTSKNKSVQLDIVARGKHSVLIGEVKWKVKPQNALVLYNKLVEDSKNLRLPGRRTYVLFSKSGFSEDTKETAEKRGCLCFDLNDMTDLFRKASKNEEQRQRTLDVFF